MGEKVGHKDCVCGSDVGIVEGCGGGVGEQS